MSTARQRCMSARVPAEVYAGLTALARERGCTLSSLVAQLLSEAGAGQAGNGQAAAGSEQAAPARRPPSNRSRGLRTRR